ncbi:hypothetical protein LTR85_001954 [Meristemomyces frigidus]|nr:hypothetical protein LTR85_001954 [Meristemomyces frigidus]
MDSMNMPLGARGMSEAFKKLYETGENSDFIISCDGHDYKVHKAILLTQSAVLYDMATNKRFKECQKGRLELRDDDPECVAAMIHYIYHLDYADKVVDGFTSLSFHTRIAILADKYNMEHSTQLQSQDSSQARTTKKLRAGILEAIVRNPSWLAESGKTESRLKRAMVEYPQFGADAAEAFAAYKHEDDAHDKAAEWYQHTERELVCSAFKAEIGDPDYYYTCFRCEKGMTGEAWQKHKIFTLYETSTQADFIITCNGEEWKVHKAVLFMHSDVLWKMSSNESFKECREGRAVLNDDDKTHLAELIYYMYHLDYKPMALRSHVGICQLAGKYNIENLKALAVKRFKTLAETKYQSDSFAAAMEDAYGAGVGNRAMCAAIVDIVVKHPSALKGQKKETPLQSAMPRYPEFAVDVANAFVRTELKYPDEKRYEHCIGSSFKARLTGDGGWTSCPFCRVSCNNKEWRTKFALT